MERTSAGHPVERSARRSMSSDGAKRLSRAWEALTDARRCLGRGDLRLAAGSVEVAVSVATQALLKSRGLPPTTHTDIRTSRAVCEIVLGSPAGRLATSACELCGLGMYPAGLLRSSDFQAARSALNSSAALVALIESEVYR